MGLIFIKESGYLCEADLGGVRAHLNGLAQERGSEFGEKIGIENKSSELCVLSGGESGILRGLKPSMSKS